MHKKLFLLLFSVTCSLSAERNTICTITASPVASTVSIEHEKCVNVEECNASMVIDFAQVVAEKKLFEHFAHTQTHSFLEQISHKPLEDLQKLMLQKKKTLERRPALKEISFSCLIKHPEPASTALVAFTFNKNTDKKQPNLEITIMSTTEAPAIQIVHFLKTLCTQDTWWHRHKSKVQLSLLAATLLAMEYTQPASYTRAAARRYAMPNQKTQYDLLFKKHLPETQIKDEITGLHYKQLGLITVALVTASTFNLPTTTAVTAGEKKDLSLIIPFSKINPSQLKKHLSQINREGWKVYLFDDLGCGMPGLTLFDPFKIRTQIEKYTVILPNNCVERFLRINESKGMLTIEETISNSIIEVFGPQMPAITLPPSAA